MSDDLHCLHCGCSLGGLRDEVVVCPQCGGCNALDDLAMPEKLVQARLRVMESGPVACLAMTILCAGVLGIAYYVIPSSDGPVYLVPWIAAGPGIGVWIAFAFDFRANCQDRKAAWRVLAKYHLYGLAFIAPPTIVLCASVAVRVATMDSTSPLWGEAWPGIALAIAVSTVAVAILAFGRSIRQRMKALLEPQHRAAAEQAVRADLRDRIRQSKRPTGPEVDMLSPDVNMFCLRCGYNLRGLSGDPRHCPECGHVNHLGVVGLSAELVERQVRRLTKLPTTCVRMAIAAVFCLAVLVELGSDMDAPCFMCPAFVLTILFVVWLGAVAGFRDACGGRPEWRRVLIRHHVWGLGLWVPASIVLVYLGRLSFGLNGRESPSVFVGVLILDTLTITAVIALASSLRQRLKRGVEPLVQEAAIAWTKREVQRRLLRR